MKNKLVVLILITLSSISLFACNNNNNNNDNNTATSIKEIENIKISDYAYWQVKIDERINFRSDIKEQENYDEYILKAVNEKNKFLVIRTKPNKYNYTIYDNLLLMKHTWDYTKDILLKLQ